MIRLACIFFVLRLFKFQKANPQTRDVVVSIIDLILDGILQGLLGEQLKSRYFCELLRKLAKMQFWGASEA